MARHPRSGKIPARLIKPIDPEGWDKDPGRPLGLLVLALLVALSFLALGISSLLPMLQRSEPTAQLREPSGQPHG